MIYLIDRFEDLKKPDFEFWDICVENIYELELEVLTLTNYSRFCQFITEQGTNRKEDIHREHAMKFIGTLRNIEGFTELVEDGDEVGVSNGREEVKFLKRDLKRAPEYI